MSEQHNCERLSWSDYFDPWYLVLVYLLVLLLWIAPQYYVIKKSPNLSKDHLKWHWILGVPSTLFEAAVSVASFSLIPVCTPFSFVVTSGGTGMLFILFDFILYSLAARTLMKNPDLPVSMATDMDSRLWELIGPLMATNKGQAVLIIFGLAAINLIACALVGIAAAFNASYAVDAEEFKTFLGGSSDSTSPTSAPTFSPSNSDPWGDDLWSWEGDDEDSVAYILGEVWRESPVQFLLSWVVWTIILISSLVFLLSPAKCWRIQCCKKKQSIAAFLVANSDEDHPPNDMDLARTRYYIIRLYILDLGGFLLNAIAGEWILVIFLVDELFFLGRLFFYDYMLKKQAQSAQDQEPQQHEGGNHSVSLDEEQAGGGLLVDNNNGADGRGIQEQQQVESPKNAIVLGDDTGLLSTQSSSVGMNESDVTEKSSAEQHSERSTAAALLEMSSGGTSPRRTTATGRLYALSFTTRSNSRRRAAREDDDESVRPKLPALLNTKNEAPTQATRSLTSTTKTLKRESMMKKEDDDVLNRPRLPTRGS